MLGGSDLHLKDKIKNSIFTVGEVTNLFFQTLHACVSRPFYFHRIVDQIVILGIGSLGITVVIGLVMGLVMTLNFGYGLAKFGGTLYVPGIVGISLTREMAPIFTSLLVAGRIGSGIAAELGSMSVTQQVDAIRALGTSPIRVLVVPRMIAAVISLPLLTALSLAFGLLGGMIICMSEFNITPSYYFEIVFSMVKFPDFGSGITKTIIFAIIITLLACYKGLNTKDGTQGVGKSTTWVVVFSSILILTSNFFLSKIFILAFPN